MQNNMNMRQPEVIDLRDVWHTLTKNVKFIRKVTLATTAVAVAYAFLMPPTYESTALLRIKPQKGINSSLLDALPMGNVQANTQLLNTYQEIIKSRSVVVPVIKKVSEPDKDGKYPSYEGYVKGNITTMPFKNTEMISVSVKGKSPELAQAANVALVESFLMRLTEIERTQYSLTRSFLEGRVVESKKDLNKAEDKLNAYRKENKVVSADNNVKMAAEKMAMVDKLRAQNTIDMAAGQAKAAISDEQLKNNTSLIADNTAIKNYNTKLAQLEQQRIDFATKYTEKHPAMIKINQDINKLKAQRNAAIDEIAKGATASDNQVYNGVLAEKFKGQAEVSVAASNIQALNRVEEQFNKDIAKLSDNQKEYLGLLRDVTVAQEIYTMLAKRLEEAKVAEVSISRDVQIVDSGDLPERPVAPRKGLSIILGFLLGLLGSGGLVVAKDLMNRTIKTTDDIEKYLGIAVLGQIPSVESLKEAKEVAELTTMQKIWRALCKK